MDSLTKRLIQPGSPFELQDAVIKGVPCKVFPYGPKTLLDVLLKAASFKQRDFIVSGDARLSFGQALEQANHFAQALRQRYGIAKGSRVAILMENSPEWAVAFMALYFAGTVPVVIHTDAEKQAVLKALEMTNSALIITDSQNTETLKAVCSSYPVVLLSNRRKPEAFPNESDGDNPLSDFPFFELLQVSGNKSTLHLDNISRSAQDDEALIAFTSGTTGTPKGVVLSHRNMTTGLMNMMLGGTLMSYRAPKERAGKQPAGPNMQPCSLLLSPFSHIGGYSQLMLMCYLGGKIVLMPEWDTENAARLIKREKVRSLSGASPAMIRELLRANYSGDKLDSLTNLNIHGAALNQGFLHEIADEFPSVSIGTGYGMTETCGSISTVSGKELLENPNTIGPVLPSVDIKIIDDAGQEISRDELGEIYVRGAMVMRGYCADSENTSTVLNDGWLRTGDLGYTDSDGNLYITDRLKDMIICGHHRISSGELERLASEHHMIDEAIALGIPSSEKCERIVLAVLPNDTQQIEEESLKEDVSSQLKNLANNTKIIMVKSFPRTASGKVNRNELRRQVTLD